MLIEIKECYNYIDPKKAKPFNCSTCKHSSIVHNIGEEKRYLSCYELNCKVSQKKICDKWMRGKK